MATRRRILVVDDEPVNRALIRARLGGEHDLVEAESGEAALSALEREPVDLVLLDVSMPGMDGLEVCRRIKARATSLLPVILVTALSDQEHRNAGLAAGADDFLGKPVDGRELVLRVRAFLQLREQDEVIRRQLEQLRRAESLRDDLISLVVHDLRNPLASLLSVLDLARMDLDELEDASPRRALDSARENLAMGKDSARKLRDLIEEILEVRRIEGGALVLARDLVAAACILDEAALTLEGEARRCGVRVRVEATGHEVRVDHRLVRRAVENLLANALRYSANGQEVEVAASVEGGRARFEVRDRGPGVPDAWKRRVFDKFATAELRDESQRRGFGMGLHMVSLVAAAHEGTASVHDRAGGGAVFRVELPA